jgi:hypothetical protein
MELKLSIDNLEELSHIANGDKYYSVCKDLSGWLNKQIAEQQYYDKETLEFVYDKLFEIMHSYGVNI